MSKRSTYFRDLKPGDSNLAWKGMRRDLQQIDEWHKVGEKAHNNAPGSLLDVIDGLTEPLQASHLLGYLLHTAVDHLHALKAQLVEAKSQHTFAPYTLIRGAIEASSTALWILQDGVPLAVATRSLRLEHVNLSGSSRFVGNGVAEVECHAAVRVALVSRIRDR
ncbi:hypothetical protein FQ377_14570 [Arthrobacter echini]|uniref:Uncharacterized protein n=1 Tax=Arthrobacter echini TaxID=1529066 RepID=A0A5D0XJ63_9MICC|nr:hypothetical protein [Arthrobacter echini]TYC95861.1 hypothetical protein FQ377_14570 [Arthrobacter echini]